MLDDSTTQLPRLTNLTDLFLASCAAQSTGLDILDDAQQLCAVQKTWVATDTWYISGSLRVSDECQQLKNTTWSDPSYATPSAYLGAEVGQVLGKSMATLFFTASLFLDHVTWMRAIDRTTLRNKTTPWLEVLHLCLLAPVVFVPYAASVPGPQSWFILTSIQLYTRVIWVIMWSVVDVQHRQTRKCRVHLEYIKASVDSVVLIYIGTFASCFYNHYSFKT